MKSIFFFNRMNVSPAVILTSLCDDGTRSGEGAEHFFPGPAYRAFPVFGQILKPGTLGNLPLSVSPVGVINIAAIKGLALPHFLWSCHIISLIDLEKGFGFGLADRALVRRGIFTRKTTHRADVVIRLIHILQVGNRLLI